MLTNIVPTEFKKEKQKGGKQKGGKVKGRRSTLAIRSVSGRQRATSSYMREAR